MISKNFAFCKILSYWSVHNWLLLRVRPCLARDRTLMFTQSCYLIVYWIVSPLFIYLCNQSQHPTHTAGGVSILEEACAERSININSILSSPPKQLALLSFVIKLLRGGVPEIFFWYICFSFCNVECKVHKDYIYLEIEPIQV